MSTRNRRAFLIACGLTPWLAAPAIAGGRPLMLANLYRPGLPLAEYWVSEKYDGVRAYWDGEQLWSRQGHRIAAPPWFTRGWPMQALDGELWAGRGRFTTASSTANRHDAGDAAWRELRYMVFDLPSHPGRFDQRLASLRQLLRTPRSRTVHLVAQHRVADEAALQALLRDTVRSGGEGLMLHHGASRYRSERSDDLLKLKPHVDADATVVGHLPGKGKYKGQLGALQVQTPEGLRFKLGSGLRDAERAAPPPIGSVVTYRYRGHHPNGLPRFATFLRVRSTP